MCEWSGVDTPKTVMTTRASAVLKTHFLESDIAAQHTFSILSLACYCLYHVLLCNYNHSDNRLGLGLGLDARDFVAARYITLYKNT